MSPLLSLRPHAHPPAYVLVPQDLWRTAPMPTPPLPSPGGTAACAATTFTTHRAPLFLAITFTSFSRAAFLLSTLFLILFLGLILILIFFLFVLLFARCITQVINEDGEAF